MKRIFNTVNKCVIIFENEKKVSNHTAITIKYIVNKYIATYRVKDTNRFKEDMDLVLQRGLVKDKENKSINTIDNETEISKIDRLIVDTTALLSSLKSEIKKSFNIELQNDFLLKEIINEKFNINY